jgi:hypothetical protein
MRGGWSRAALLALYGLASYAFCSPLFAQPTALGVFDWDQHLFYYGAVLKNVVEYGQMPFWNPWYCGGNVLWQNPQIALLSPVYPLTAFMPLALAMKVNILLHYWAGFVGMHLLLSRVIGVRSRPMVFFLATMFTASGAPAIHFMAGHSVFLPAFYLPWVLYFFFRSLTTRTLHGALLAGVAIALMVYNGGTHILPMAIAVIGFLALVAAVARRQWQPLLIGAVCCIAGLAYSAPKLVPVVSYVSSSEFWDTRPATGHPDLTTLEMARGIYLDANQKARSRLPEQRHGWHEYGNYIGPFAAILIVAGVLWTLTARRAADYWLGLSLAGATLALFVWSLGEFSPLAPASLATHLPLFSSFRIPARYTIAFVLCAAATVGWAARTLNLDAPSSRVARATIALVCIAAAGHLIARNRVLLVDVFSQPPLTTTFKPLAGPRQLETDFESNAYQPSSPMFTSLMNDRSFFYCYESLQLKRTSTPDPRLVIVNGDAQLTETVFTPNRIAFTVTGGRAPSRILLNQNYATGWRSDAGAFTPTPETLPGVTMAAGQTGTFAFWFVPDGLWLGLGVFVTAVAVSLLAVRRRQAERT